MFECLSLSLGWRVSTEEPLLLLQNLLPEVSEATSEVGDWSWDGQELLLWSSSWLSTGGLSSSGLFSSGLSSSWWAFGALRVVLCGCVTVLDG